MSVEALEHSLELARARAPLPIQVKVPEAGRAAPDGAAGRRLEEPPAGEQGTRGGERQADDVGEAAVDRRPPAGPPAPAPRSRPPCRAARRSPRRRRSRRLRRPPIRTRLVTEAVSVASPCRRARLHHREAGDHLVLAPAQVPEHAGRVGGVSRLAEQAAVQHHLGVGTEDDRRRRGRPERSRPPPGPWRGRRRRWPRPAAERDGPRGCGSGGSRTGCRAAPAAPGAAGRRRPG